MYRRTQDKDQLGLSAEQIKAQPNPYGMKTPKFHYLMPLKTPDIVGQSQRNQGVSNIFMPVDKVSTM